MKLSTKNIFAKYYKWLHGKLPNDVCSFFWGILLPSLGCLFYIPGRLIEGANDNSSNKMKSGIMSYLFIIGFICFGSLFYSKEQMMSFNSIWILLLILFGTGLGLVVCIIASIAVVALLYKWNDNRKYKLRLSKPQQPTISRSENIKIWIGAIRKKHCTKIEWDGEL